MKKIFTLLTIISSSLSSLAQSHVAWTTPEITPGSQVNLYKGTNTDQHGNTYTIHFTQDPVNHYFTYRFFCYNNAGVKQWQYNNDSCFTNCQDIYSIIVPIDNDGAIFIGYYNGLTGPWEIRIKRIDINGNLVWQNSWTQYFAAYPVTAQLDNSGNLVVALNAYIASANDQDFAFAKFDVSNGNNIWHYEIPDAGGISGVQDEEVWSMVIDNADNIYGCGKGGFINYYFKVNSGGSLGYELIAHDNDSMSPFNGAGVSQIQIGNNNDLYLLASPGNNTWVQKYEASSGNFIKTKIIAHDSALTIPVSFIYDNNNIYTLTNYNYFIPDTTWAGGHSTNKEYMITKIDTGGTTLWEKTYLEDLDSAAQETATGGADQMLVCNGNVYVLSTATTDSIGNSIILALNKIDAAGNISWYDTEPADFGAGNMAADNNCNIYVTRSENLIGQYLHVTTQKFTDNVTAVNNVENTNVAWTLYPNPSSDLININTMGKDAFEVRIYNALGNVVMQQQNKKQMSVATLPPGFYFVRLDSNGLSSVKKFIKQ